MKWYDPEKQPPEMYVSVLVYMPEEDPLPTIHEGYMAEDGIWWANGFYRRQKEIARWTELPQYDPADDADDASAPA